MGGSSWSDDHYASRSAHYAKTKTSAFKHEAAVRSGSVRAGTHEDCDPSKMKGGVREVRDSDDHPESNPVFIGLDVTASMSSVPRMIQAKLPSLMGLLLKKGYLSDPAICVAAIGDVKYDSAPFQVGQFESGIEIEDELGKLYMEGGGGGNRMESYDMALWFLANHVRSDADEKRNKKGYAFIICDEQLSEVVLASEIEKIFGKDARPQADVKTSDLIEQVLDKWELYCIIPKMTSHYSDKSYRRGWEALWQNVLYLEDPDGISELIASIIGIMEEAIDSDSIVSDIVDTGGSRLVGEAVSTTLSKLSAGGSLSKITKETGLATL